MASPEHIPETSYRELLASPVRIRHLVTALSIADAGSIAGASTALHVAQPATSRTLQQLESTIGLKLFDRLPRGMQPTEAGEVFLANARGITTALTELHTQLHELRTGATGTIRIGTVVAGAADLIPLAIARFAEQNPFVKFRLIESNPDSLYQSLQAGELDVVIGRLLPLSERDHVETEAFYQDSVQVLVRSGHPLAARKRLKLEQLIDHSWILPPPGTALRSQIDQRFEAVTAQPPRRVIECVTMPTVRRLLIETDSIAVVPTGALGSDMTSGNLLTSLPVTIAAQSVPIGVIRRSGVPLSRACEEFLAIARTIGRPG